MLQQRSSSQIFFDALLLLSVCLALTFGLFCDVGVGSITLGIVAPFLAIGTGRLVSLRSKFVKRELLTHLTRISGPYILLIVFPLVCSSGIALLRGDLHGKAALLEFAECFLFWMVMELSVLFAWENSKRAKWLFLFCAVALFVNFLFWVATGAGLRFDGFSTHKNVVGGVSLVIGTLCLAQILAHPPRDRWPLVLVITLGLSLVMTFASSSRTSLMCLLAATCLVAVSKRIYLSRMSLWVFLIGTLVFVALVPPIYLNLERLWFFESLDQAFRSVSNNGIYSGRETKWGQVWTEVASQPVFGYGYQWKLVFSHKTMHAHNLYLGKLFQTGVFGFLCFLAFNLSCIRQSIQSDKPKIGCLYSIVFVHQCFEINYTMGGVPVGCAIAVLIGALLRLANHDEIED